MSAGYKALVNLVLQSRNSPTLLIRSDFIDDCWRHGTIRRTYILAGNKLHFGELRPIVPKHRWSTDFARHCQGRRIVSPSMDLSRHRIQPGHLNWIILHSEVGLQSCLDPLSFGWYLWILSVEPREMLLEVIPRSAVESHPPRPSAAVHHCRGIELYRHRRQKAEEKDMSSEKENGSKEGRQTGGLHSLLGGNDLPVGCFWERVPRGSARLT